MIEPLAVAIEAARAAGDLGDIAPPAWVLADVPLNDLSSTAIRAKGEWGKSGPGGTRR